MKQHFQTYMVLFAVMFYVSCGSAVVPISGSIDSPLEFEPDTVDSTSESSPELEKIVESEIVSGFPKVIKIPAGQDCSITQYFLQRPDVAKDEYFGTRPLEHYQRHGQSEKLCRPVSFPSSLSIQKNILGSAVTVSASSQMGGSIDSMTFRGVQYIDRKDNGRELQTAASYDGYGECYNPTEAGNRIDHKKNTTSSSLIHFSNGNNLIKTLVNMAFWMPPNTKYEGRCGQSDAYSSINTTLRGEYLLSKSLSFGFEDIPNVLNHEVIYRIPRSHSKATFEASTGYMPKTFSRALVYDPQTKTLNNATAKATSGGEQPFPPIFSTSDGQHAMGVFSPNLPSLNQGGYGLWFWGGEVSKWNCVYREYGLVKGDYKFQCLIPFGSIKEVTQALDKLWIKFQKGRVLGLLNKIPEDNLQNGLMLSGFACSQGIANPIDIRVYVDGPEGKGGKLIRTSKANLSSNPQIKKTCQSESDHNFVINLSSKEIQEFQGKRIYIHGVSQDPNRFENFRLENSGRYEIPVP